MLCGPTGKFWSPTLWRFLQSNCLFITTHNYIYFVLCIMHMHLPTKKVNQTTSTPWLLQSWAIYLNLYVFNKGTLIEHTYMLKLINCWAWIRINIYVLNQKLFTKAHLKLIKTKHFVFLHIFIRSTCRLLKCNIKKCSYFIYFMDKIFRHHENHTKHTEPIYGCILIYEWNVCKIKIHVTQEEVPV